LCTNHTTVTPGSTARNFRSRYARYFAPSKLSIKTKKNKPTSRFPALKSGRWAVLAFFSAIAIHGTLGWQYLSAKSATYDEAVHLAAGYSYLRTGDYQLNIRDHPPLAEMAAALGLLHLNPAFNAQHAHYRPGGEYKFSHAFLYSNRIPAERMLAAARSAALTLWTIIFFGAGLWWCRRVDPHAVPWTAGAFAFAPMLLANSPLIATDAGAAALMFAATVAAREALLRRGPGWVLAAGTLCGLALSAKFNAVILPPALLILTASENALDKHVAWKRFFLGIGAAIATASLVLLCIYGPAQIHLFVDGLSSTFARVDAGRRSFAWGTYSNEGVWWYFPLALLLKTPIPILLLVPLGLWAAPSRERIWLAAFPTLYFFAALQAHVQIGYRHILPVVPFLLILAGLGAATLWRGQHHLRWLAPILALWFTVGTVRAHPHHLAYFNELAGGPSGGHRFLVDSNLDWGQDLPALSRELAADGNPPIFLAYFGTADPAHYGIRYIPAAPPLDVFHPGTGEDSQNLERILIAVSATHLQGVYLTDRAAYDWLKTRSPKWTAGHSLQVFDLSQDRKGLLRLARLMGGLGNHAEATRLRKRASRL
jgi:hypothetical protein